MKPEVKEKWVAALRSGEYQQGLNVLAHRDDEGAMSYCCLGVLCDLAVKDGVAVDVQSDADGDLTFEGMEALPPSSVLNWARLRLENPEVQVPKNHPALADQFLDVRDRKGKCALTSLNDGGFTFAEIADLIEASL